MSIRKTPAILITIVFSIDLTISYHYQTSAQEAVESPAVARLLDVRSGAEISINQMIEKVVGCDVLFLGETHDNDVGHSQQLVIIEAIHARRPDLVISMEMFERDVQGALSDYLRGRIDEATFLEASRPWKNYQQHYRPIVEFAKRNRLDVIASNVPRQLARDMANGNSVASSSPLLARDTSAPEDAYFELFKDVMQGHVGTDSPDALQHAYQAQCLKDDTMAESITDYIATHRHRSPLVVHLCGRFHSDYGYGTAFRVLCRKPLTKISVVSMEAVDDVSSDPDRIDSDLADFLLLVPHN